MRWNYKNNVETKNDQSSVVKCSYTYSTFLEFDKIDSGA